MSTAGVALPRPGAWPVPVTDEIAGQLNTSDHTAQDLVAFCRAQHPRLVGMLGLYTGDFDLAEELAQEALLRACRDWARVRDYDAPGAWLHRVAMNLANSSLRRLAVRRRAIGTLRRRPYDDHRDPDSAAAVALRSALATLPSKMRAVLVLRFYEDLSVREVADTLGWPEGTVKTLSTRGIARLRAAGLGDDAEAVDAH